MGSEGRGLATKIVGLTGSIGSGKSYVLGLFAGAGVPTQSSDDIAHELIDGDAFEQIAKRFPDSVAEGKISKQSLGDEVFADADKKKALEEVLHPLVRARNIEFADSSSAKFVVIEIPLLFESGAERYCDYVIALNVSRETMQKRALERAHMTAEKFDQIFAAQMPAEEKVARAEFVIDNEAGDDTVGQVRKIVAELNNRID